MNKYYRLKFKHPKEARQALEIILKQNPNDVPAMVELSQWLLDKENYHEAITLLERIREHFPGVNDYTFQLAYAYYAEGDWRKPEALYKQAMLDEPLSVFREKARVGIDAMSSFLPFYQDEAKIHQSHASINTEPKFLDNAKTSPNSYPKTQTPQRPTRGLNKFYALRHVHKQRAFLEIQRYVKKHPTHVTALKEAAYLAFELHQRSLAIDYFTRAYALRHDSALALQLAYLYNENKQNKIGNVPEVFLDSIYS